MTFLIFTLILGYAGSTLAKYLFFSQYYSSREDSGKFITHKIPFKLILIPFVLFGSAFKFKKKIFKRKFLFIEAFSATYFLLFGMVLALKFQNLTLTHFLYFVLFSTWVIGVMYFLTAFLVSEILLSKIVNPYSYYCAIWSLAFSVILFSLQNFGVDSVITATFGLQPNFFINILASSSLIILGNLLGKKFLSLSFLLVGVILTLSISNLIFFLIAFIVIYCFTYVLGYIFRKKFVKQYLNKISIAIVVGYILALGYTGNIANIFI